MRKKKQPNGNMSTGSKDTIHRKRKKQMDSELLKEMLSLTRYQKMYIKLTRYKLFAL